MMIIQYSHPGASDETMECIEQVRKVCNEKCFLAGFSVVIKDTRDLMDSELPMFVGLAVLLALCAMLLTLESTVLPFIFLASIGFAVIYNFGSNIFLGEISYITKAIAAVLQLGVTMDYSIFLYHRYEEDIALMAGAGLNAYRFSIEWARVEPQEGCFDESELEHYRKVIRCCREHGVEPVVTLHHFSSPKWLIERGGWEAESTVDYFKRYAVKVVEALGDELHYICTINEANVGLQIAAISKRYMMQMQKAAAARAAAGQAESSVQMGMNLQKMLENRKAAAAESLALFGTENPQTFQTQRTPEGDLLIMRAHAAARDAIKAICPELKVGLTLSLHDLQPEPGCEALAAKEWAEEFTHYLPYIQNDDFLGVQNYTRTRIGPDGQLPMPEGAELTQMGYEFYPQALANVLRAVAKDFHGDLLITENGIGTGDDTRRVEFIRQALAGVQDCLAEGLPIKGYLHWSLLDNFEWQKGFSMTFGLIAVDRANGQTRHPKPSLAFLGSYAAD